MKTEKTIRGVVTEALPNAEFRVFTKEKGEIRAYLSGKMRKFQIYLAIGDTVEVVYPPNTSIGRIITRVDDKSKIR